MAFFILRLVFAVYDVPARLKRSIHPGDSAELDQKEERIVDDGIRETKRTIPEIIYFGAVDIGKTNRKRPVPIVIRRPNKRVAGAKLIIFSPDLFQVNNIKPSEWGVVYALP